jgi:protein gp37
VITDIRIDEGFRDQLFTPRREELDDLEADIIEHGCRDALVVWADAPGGPVLLDGHNRYRICQKHGLPYRVEGLAFPDRVDAEEWIDRNQHGRRNLTDDQRRLLRGRMYNRRKKSQGAPPGNANAAKQSGQVDHIVPKTSETIAAQFGVSEKTVRRDAKFAEEVEREPELLGAVLSVEPVRKVKLEIAKRKGPYVTLAQWNDLTAIERAEVMTTEPSGDLNKTDGPGIEWAHWSWNPVTGCKHGCAYCYARDIANRFYPQGFEPTFHPNRLQMPIKRKPVEGAAGPARNIFTCSMADLFGKWVPQEWIDSVFNVITEADHWNFLCLTKFPQRLAELQWPRNAWVGATVDAQNRVDLTVRSFEKLKESSPAITWLSLEPLLEPLSFPSLAMFDWVVIGGASKSSQTEAFTPPRAWVESLIEMADRDGCTLFLKTNLRYRQEIPG